MKKILIAFVVGLTFSLPSYAATETNFVSSGIDLDASTINIAYIASSGAATMECLGNFSSPQTHTFTAAGWNSSTGVFDNLDEDSKCFKEAGTYTVTTTVVDKAGNSATPLIETFIVKPGNVENTESDLTGTCANGIADFNEQCSFELFLKDKYGNTIDVQQPRVYSDTGNFSDDANVGIKFRDGLRVKGSGAAYAVIPSSVGVALENDKDFSLRALAPSIVKETEMPDGSVIGVLNYLGDWLSVLTTRSVNFVFTNLKPVNPDGSLGAGNVPDLEKPKDLKFKNPFVSIPAVAGVTMGDPFNIDIETNREISAGAEPISNGKVYVRNLARDSSDNLEEFCDENGEDCEVFDENYIDSFPSIPNIKTYTKKLAEPEGVNFDPDKDYVDLVTEIEYSLDGQTVRYPAGAAGNAFEGVVAIGVGNRIDTKFIGADIEGLVRANSDNTYFGNEGENLNIGLNSGEVDIYEKIVKNGWELARNSVDPLDTNVIEGNFSSLFDTNNVRVVDLTGKTGADAVFSISGDLPAGKNTLVLIDGNLKITGDLEYQNNADSFGVILLRNAAGPYPEVGNIFVNSDVQRIAGTYFADGGFMNNTTNYVADGNKVESTYQLLLEGALFSSNTLGGSIVKAGENTDYTPWESDATQVKALPYDLHFVRRYDPSKGHMAVPNMPAPANDAAFVIRQDGKVASSPPPGFKSN